MALVMVLGGLLGAAGLCLAGEVPRLPQERAGLEEQLGAVVPLDAEFTDEEGRPVRLGDLVDRPTILAPVYYRCSQVCNLLQAGLADVLPQLNVDREKIRVLSVSFDPDETPALAQGSRRIYQGVMRGAFPAGQWSFLTGDQHNIHQLMEAIGYHYVRDGREFIHPVAIVVLSPEGKIVRYLNGTRFLPMDLSLALLEASEGRVGSTISRIASFCFRYDPEKKGYVFNMLRVAGGIVFVSAAGLFTVLVLPGRKNRRPRG